MASSMLHAPDYACTGSLCRHPVPFKCRIVPRSPGMDAEKLDQLIAASSP